MHPETHEDEQEDQQSVWESSVMLSMLIRALTSSSLLAFFIWTFTA